MLHPQDAVLIFFETGHQYTLKARHHFFTSSRRQFLLRERQNTGRVFLRKWRGIDEFPDFFRITLKHRCAFAVTLPPQQVINRTTATTFSPDMKFNYHPAPP
ncbi:hypothetical protein P2R66_24270, partial [Escherichia coli]